MNLPDDILWGAARMRRNNFADGLVEEFVDYPSAEIYFGDNSVRGGGGCFEVVSCWGHCYLVLEVATSVMEYSIHGRLAKTFGTAGKVLMMTNNDNGYIIEDVVLCQESGNYGVDIPKNVWHKLDSLEAGSVIFECKEGPFVPHEVEGILEVKSEK